jgi:integrase/recombinase XerD
MTRKEARAKKPVAGDPNDPDGMYAWSRRYLEALRVKGYSERTVDNRDHYLGLFTEWCEARSVVRPTEVTKPMVDRYQRYLYHYRKPHNGKPLTFAAQISRLVAVRSFFKWLARQNVLLWNPASEIELPKQEKRLPRFVLSADEAELVMMQPNVHEPIGVRDRAMLETLYSTGVRRMEVIHLTVFDLDAERGTLTVRQGKGKKDRMVPIGERAILWVQKYLGEVRPELVIPPDTGTLFLTKEGEALSPNQLTDLARSYVSQADIGKTGACHLWRHTCATLMLEGGADVRYIQEMLGHVRLETTQIYTQVSIRRLKAIHALTHPGATLDRPVGVEATGTEHEGADDLLSLGAEPKLRGDVGAVASAAAPVEATRPEGESERASATTAADSTTAAMRPLARCDAPGQSREDAATELLLSLALEAEEEDEALERGTEELEGSKQED